MFTVSTLGDPLKGGGGVGEIGKLPSSYICSVVFLKFVLYGSCEVLDGINRFSQGAPTISTLGNPHSDNFLFLDVLDPEAAVFFSERAYYYYGCLVVRAESISCVRCDRNTVPVQVSQVNA